MREGVKEWWKEVMVMETGMKVKQARKEERKMREWERKGD